MAKLEIRKVRKVSAMEVAEKPLTIGRSSLNDIVLRDNRVSRRHCVIEMVKGRVVIRDVGSQKGTFVNGHKVNGEAVLLAPGDRIAVRPFELHFDPSNRAAVERQAASMEQQVNDLRRQSETTIAQRDDLQRQLDIAREQWQQCDQRGAELEATLQTARSEIDQHLHTIAERTQHLEALKAAAAPLREQLARVESQSQRDALVAAKMIETHRQEIEHLREQQATLQRRIGETESALRAAESHDQRATDTIVALDRQLAVLEDTARMVEMVQDRLGDAEAAWAEIDRTLEIAPDATQAQIDAAGTLRRHLSSQLIELHRERDDAVIQLKDLIVALRVVMNRHGPVEELPHRLESPRRLRRWLGMGAGSR